LWTITDASNVVAARYLYGEGVDQVQGRIVEAGPNAGTQGFYATDSLGSVRDIVDAATGDVLFHAEYDAFGAATEYGAGYGDTLKFTAREFDADTGLQYNRARWYDNSVGRWLSEDPIGFAAGDHNLYRYVGNFSTGATDPRGTDIYLAGKEWNKDENGFQVDSGLHQEIQVDVWVGKGRKRPNFPRNAYYLKLNPAWAVFYLNPSYNLKAVYPDDTTGGRAMWWIASITTVGIVTPVRSAGRNGYVVREMADPGNVHLKVITTTQEQDEEFTARLNATVNGTAAYGFLSNCRVYAQSWFTEAERLYGKGKRL
jgi:RHS repeat-associated protein